MTIKTAFLFSGQGSQYVGMGREVMETYPYAARLMSRASDILGFDLKKLCLEGPADVLNNTRNTQPAIYTISMMIYRILHKKGITPSVVAGHSLGEYTALAAARVFSFEEGLRLVRKRGILMDEALPAGQGTMAAIIGLAEKEIDSICQGVGGICQVANYNSPGQIVISGENSAVINAMKKADNAGAKRVIELQVSGPFHSRLMEAAREELAREIESIKFNKPSVPVIANTTADYVTTSDEIKDALINQLISSVYWTDTINLMISNGITNFVEVGPGRVLKGLMRRINRSVMAYNVEDMAGLNKLLQVYEKEEVRS